MTLKYFHVFVIDRSWPWVLWVASTGFLFLVTLITSHLLGLNDNCQYSSHCCSLSRSLCSAVVSAVLDILRYMRLSHRAS